MINFALKFNLEKFIPCWAFGRPGKIRGSLSLSLFDLWFDPTSHFGTEGNLGAQVMASGSTPLAILKYLSLPALIYICSCNPAKA